MTPYQIKAARSLLGWTKQASLAPRTGGNIGPLLT